MNNNESVAELPVWRVAQDFATLETLTHWNQVTHIGVGTLAIIIPDYGLSPGQRQAIIWTNDALLLIGSLGTNFSEIFIEIHTFSFEKMHLKMSFAKCQPFCHGLNSSWRVDCKRRIPSEISGSFPGDIARWYSHRRPGPLPRQGISGYIISDISAIFQR